MKDVHYLCASKDPMVVYVLLCIVCYTLLLNAYMSTQREVLEGQTGSHRAKRANFGRGARGFSPGKFQKPTLQMVQSMLFLSNIL